MKPWLPALLNEMEAGRKPVLVLSTRHQVAQAAVTTPDGTLLAGILNGQGAREALKAALAALRPGGALVAQVEDGPVLAMESLAAPASLDFWQRVAHQIDGAWAAWLLTVPQIDKEGRLGLKRHVLSAFGPGTTPRLPESLTPGWSLMPLIAGLGKLYIFGDDDLALECAALAARVGLTVTLVSTAEPGPEVDEARQVGDFAQMGFAAWEAITPETLSDMGFRAGVLCLVTTPMGQDFKPHLEALEPAWLAFDGEAKKETEAPGAGLFPQAATVTQKALGLIAEMLTKRGS